MLETERFSAVNNTYVTLLVPSRAKLGYRFFATSKEEEEEGVRARDSINPGRYLSRRRRKATSYVYIHMSPPVASPPASTISGTTVVVPPPLPAATSATPQRRCANCSCTETPLWRRSPLGPKTLCNACGVRMKKGRLLFVAQTGGFVTVESPAACAKRMRKEREERERRERGENSGGNVAGHGGRGFGGGCLGQGSGGGEVVGGTGLGGNGSGNGSGRGVVKSSQRRRKGFKGASGLYYLLAAIEFVETA